MTSSVKSLSAAEAEARSIVNRWSVGAAAVGWVPGSMLALAAADVKIVKDVAAAFGVQAFHIDEVTAALGASVAGKVIAGELLSLIPVAGWAIKSGVAAGITKTMGETLIAYFRDRSPYTA